MLRELAFSSWGLVARFYGDNQPTPKASIAVLNEEVDEMKRAIWEHQEGLTRDTGEIYRELADVMVTAINVVCCIDGHEPDIDLLERAISKTILKNDAKNNNTHEVDLSGKIARKRDLEHG